MGKKLAIKGHSTRGNEVIELLEMIGGKNIYNLTGTKEIWYILSNTTIEHSAYLSDEKGFTLEEFLEKFPFKVGDVIRFSYNGMLEEIAEMEWDEELEDIIYTSVSGTKRPCSVPKNTNNKDCPNNTSKDMEENKVDLTLKVKGESYYGNCISYQIPDGYEVSKIENGEIILQKKKPKYPKTYSECCEVFGLNHYLGISWNSYDEYSGVITCLPKQIDDIGKKLELLSKLLICRNAYWKIYGEKMGLDGSWKSSKDKMVYSFYRHSNEIETDVFSGESEIFEFPTEEMRNDFMENFDQDIEICKELL